jgi:hypothetical protein
MEKPKSAAITAVPKKCQNAGQKKIPKIAREGERRKRS